MASRFASTSKEDLETIINGAHAQGTIDKGKWAFSTFKEWLSQWRLKINDDIPKVLKDIPEFTPSDLDHCLQYFVCDVRKVTGERYPPKTLKDLISSLNFHLNKEFEWKISILNDDSFCKTRKALDGEMKHGARLGLVRPAKRASAISLKEEEDLWENGTFGTARPKQILQTLIYFFGIHFSLRAAQEHRALEYGENSQLELKKDETGQEYLEYTERVSKNKRFGLKCTRIEPKCTRMYSRPGFVARCPINVYKIYLSHRPENNGREGNTSFYLSPISETPKSNLWFKAIPFGLHSIQSTTKEVMNSLNKKTFVSNTSLRRTAQNRLLKKKIPKEIIEKKTGRISDAATSAYIEQGEFEKEMSSALYGAENDNPTNSRSNMTVDTTNNNTNIGLSLNMDQSQFMRMFTNNSFHNCTFNINFNKE